MTTNEDTSCNTSEVKEHASEFNRGESSSDPDAFLWTSLAHEEAEEEQDETASRAPRTMYNSKKPKWWRQQSGRPSSRMKQTIQSMEDYNLVQPKYGDFVDWNKVFHNIPEKGRELWIEVGFGLGDNLLCLGEQHPNRCFVGSEVHVSGVGTVLSRMQDSIQTQRYWQDYMLLGDEHKPPSADDGGQDDKDGKREYTKTKESRHPYQNLRIFRKDVTKLLPHIPDRSVDAVLVTFPDPFFPGGVQWRLLQADILAEFARVLKTGQRLYLATDHEQYYKWVEEQMLLANESRPLLKSLDEVPHRSTWLPVVSKYEQKARQEGRTKTFLACWETL